jgi:outer membrane lipoprotein carrier protein
MKINMIILSASLLLTLAATGQNDIEAIRILDSFSSNALKAPSVSMKFNMVTVNLTENTSDTLNGSIILAKDKYKLDLPNNIVWFNGESTWSYLPAEKEVTITRPDRKDHSFQNRPSEIFSMYKNGFKSRLIEDRPESYIIDLYPEDIKSDLVRVRLVIGKSTLNLISLEYKKKDGVLITLHVADYNLKLKPDGDIFVFHPEKCNGVEINDIRR